MQLNFAVTWVYGISSWTEIYFKWSKLLTQRVINSLGMDRLWLTCMWFYLVFNGGRLDMLNEKQIARLDMLNEKQISRLMV
jgi:hypothetical protein